MGYSLTQYQDRLYADYMALQDGTDEIECPVLVTECAEGNHFRDKETGRMISAETAVEMMEEISYKGTELGDAQWNAGNKEYLKTGDIRAYERWMA